MRKVKVNNNNGFTIIEVLTAIAVLSAGILAMQVMQGFSIDENSKSSGITNKSMLAASFVEQILNKDYDDPLWLDDVDGDGTNQDADLNGLDDNDDGDVNTTFLNEDFGLRHRQCCPGGVDPRGNAVAGCVAIADYCAVYEDYEVYWNVAVDYPIENTKTINVIVVDSRDKSAQTREAFNRAEYRYIKDDVI